MTAKLARILGIFALLVLLLAPAGAQNAAAQTAPRHAPNPQIPAELISQLPLGLTVDEFVNRLDGPVPHALLPYTSKPVPVIIEMSQPALAASLSAVGPNSAAVQRDYVQTLSQAQAPVVSAVQGFSGTVLGQYTKAYDGVLAMVPGKDLAALSALPGVKAVHDAPVSKLDLVHSVPLIRADQVWNSLHYTGSGERIAIIDTGIDYTHAAFGGPGTAAAYAGNNPDVVEPGTFPTAKVIGGYDFAGSSYDASSSDPAKYIPHPDADPLDENGHGTHVASIAAGQEVDANGQVVIGAGVAKDASLYALKIFGKSGSSVLEINAIEWAMDPNGDGNIADHVDVINMSLGSSWGAASDTNPTQVAVNNAAAIGIVVVASAGNAGNSSYVTSAPAVASRAISVASSTTGYDNYPSVHSGANRIAPYVPGNPFKSPVSGALVDVSKFDSSLKGDLCNPSLITPDHALQGKIALAVRGTCTFATKITNAANLGAIAVIIYNYNTPPDTLVDMDTGGTTLPAGFTLYSYGLILKTYNSQPVTVGPDSDAFAFPIGTPDTVSTFSSRGPRGYDSALKPEITAPGDAIRAALWGSGNGAVTYGGTSMAAPHVAGVAALIRQAHPAWTPEEVKAAIMGTAVDMAASDPDGFKVVPRTGAGRVDALNAVSAKGLAFGDPDLVSLNWGVVEVGDNTTSYLVPQAKTIRVKNVDSAPHTYALSYEFTNPTAMKGAAFNLPASLTVPPGSTAGTGFTLTLDPTQLPVNFGGMEEYYGFIHLDSSDGGGSLRIPFYFVPRPYASLSEAPGSNHDMSYNGIRTTSIVYNQSGPTASSLAAWPLYISMPNSPQVDDMGELHLASVDYAYKDAKYGDMLSVAIANWGRLHTLQYQFNETLLLIDLKGDNNVEYGFINYQLGNYLNAASEDNRWITARINYTVSPPVIDAYSPVFIKADFNSGFQEWQIPASMMGLSNQTKFTYQFWAWDENATNSTPQQVTAPVIFDYTLPPYNFNFTDPAPHNSQTTLQVSVAKIFGVYDNKPNGVMVVDYNGKPGLGQAFVTPVTIKDEPVYHLPIIIK